MSDRLCVDFLDSEFQNPLGTASGTFGSGREYSEYFDLNILGHMTTKSITVTERPGNPPPRIIEAPSGLLNSIGLQNDGISSFIFNDIPFLPKKIPVIANISGAGISEYVDLALRLNDHYDSIYAVEVNVSCPNVSGGGMAFGVNPEVSADITRAVKKVCSRIHVIVKLTPNITDITTVAKACEDAGADALSMINTVTGMRIDTKTLKPILPRGTGGLSGPAILPIGIAAVHRCYEAVKIPIIGMGGVSTASDVIEYMAAGATLVNVGSALFRNPLVAAKIIDGLEAYCEEHRIDIQDIIGSAH